MKPNKGGKPGKGGKPSKGSKPDKGKGQPGKGKGGKKTAEQSAGKETGEPARVVVQQSSSQLTARVGKIRQAGHAQTSGLAMRVRLL